MRPAIADRAGSVQTQFHGNAKAQATQLEAKQKFKAAPVIGCRRECAQGLNIPATGMPAEPMLRRQLPAVIVRIDIHVVTQRRMQPRQ
jgi:hypothetical protein